MKNTYQWWRHARRELEVFGFFLSVICLLMGMPGKAEGRQVLPGHVPAAVSNLAPLGRLQGSQQLSLAISLPLRNQQALAGLLRQISDPSSPNYRHYLTPAQFTERFGPTETDYQAVIHFAQTQGLKVTATHPNRTILDVKGAVSDIENTFHVKMWSYQHPSEARTFYAPDANPSVDLATPVLSVSGMDNYSLPHPRYKVHPATGAAKAKAGHSSPNTGSGPSGLYMGNDFRAAYAPGVSQTGTGQAVGLLEFDGYTTGDITYYESAAGLPNVTLTNVLLDGFSGAPSGNGNELEVSLDIEMAVSMAPGESNILVYEAGPYGNWHDILNRMATDNLAKQLSCSWYIRGGAADPTADQIFQQMAAQGQSFFSASGDSDAYTGLIPFPGDTPYITEVGGTTLNTSGPGGTYISESVWNWDDGTGSSGGISTQYTIPTWQQGISMTANQGSTTMRNVPDVALTANEVYVRVDGEDEDVGGTSCAAPLWAAFTALVNQQAVMNTGTTVGFINPAIYAIGQGAGYTSDFHDTTVGNDFSSSSPAEFSAVTGYDLCTGLGTPNGTAMINALAGSPVPIIMTGNALPAGLVGTAYNQGLTANGGIAPYSYSISSGSLPLGLGLGSTGVISGTPTASGTANFSVQVTDSKGNSSTTAFSLLVYPLGTPIIATSSPLPAGTMGATYDQTLTANGGATPYTWNLFSGSLPSGLSLSGAGVISGTPTALGATRFTVQVTDNNGLSSTASLGLTILPVPPVITGTLSATGTTGTAFSYQITATNNPTSYGASGLPAGLSVNTSTGLIGGTPTSTGVSTVTLSATNAGGTGSAPMTITVLQAPSITDGPPPAATLHTAYSFTYTASGDPTPVFSVTSGVLPSGLALSSAGIISGTPSATGTYPGTVTASNGVGIAATQNFSIVVQQALAITNGPPPAATLNTPYSFTYATTGYPRPTFSITAGALPTGITLSSAGVISGTPTVSGTYTGTVIASNGAGPNVTQSFSINVSPTPVAPVINPEPPLVGGTTNTVSWGSAVGAVQYDVQVSTSSVFAAVVDSGWVTGNSYTFSGLSIGTAYYYRIRARNSYGPDGNWEQVLQTDFNADSLTNALNGNGNLYIEDSGNDTIRNVTPVGAVTTFAGLAGTSGSTDGTGSSARFSNPEGSAVDASGNIYVTDYGNDTIRKITPGGTTTTVAGLAGTPGSTDGTGSAARFNGPFGLAIDASGNLYVADRSNQTIRKVTPGGIVTTFAGLAGNVGSSDGTGSAARFNGPAFPALDSGGNLYVADQSNSTIRKITPGAVVTTLAGLVGSFSSADGTGSAARFDNPSSIAVDGSGNLYVTDNGNDTIRKVTPGGTVTTLAGLAGTPGSANGTGSAARFDRPHGIGLDSAGNIFVSDNYNDTVRRITPGAVVTTLAGSPLLSGTTDGSGSVARFKAPAGVAVNGSGGITLLSSGTAYAPAGSVVSTTLAPSPLQSWALLSYSDNLTTSGTTLTVDVLNSSGTLLAANVSSGTDLSTVPAIDGVTGIQLRANLSTSNSANTPTLVSWSVGYYSNSLSAWSTPISSTQGLAPVITNGPPLATTVIDAAYNFTYTASGSPAPAFSLTAGTLPPGLVLSTAGILSGTPSQAGTYTGTITASNGVGPDASQGFSIAVEQTPAITSDPPPISAAVSSGYNFTFTSSGYPAPTFSLTSGSLPPGLALSPAGVISGTPTATGTYTGTVTASNGTGTNATQNFTIYVTGPATDTPTMPPWGLASLAALLVVIASRLLPQRGSRRDMDAT